MIYQIITLFDFAPMLFAASFAFITVDQNTSRFRLEDGRQIYFHGLNAVQKLYPYVPKTSGTRDYNTTIVKEDIDFLKQYGFNFIRLGVMWPGVMPEQGQINMTYLQEIDVLINKLGQQGIYTLVDMHQDLLSPYSCGEGLPDWVMNYTRKGVQDFPEPVTNYSYDAYRDSITHEVDHEKCLQIAFAKYYNSDFVGNMYECLYNKSCNPFSDYQAVNDDDFYLQTQFKYFWGNVSAFFKDNQYVVAYDILNEPIAGNRVTHPYWFKNNTAFDIQMLQPFYQQIMPVIRDNDPNHLLFFEPTVTQMDKPGFSVGGPGYPVGIPSQQQVYAWHFYCMTVDARGNPELPAKLCRVVDDFWYEMRLKYGKQMKVAQFVGEFGAVPDTDNFSSTLEHEVSLMSRDGQSWAYWAFKTFGDITTADTNESGSLNEGLFRPDLTLQERKVRTLSHPYAQIVAGQLESGLYDFGEDTLTLKMKTGKAGEKTEVFISPLYDGFGKSVKYVKGEKNIKLYKEGSKIILENVVSGLEVEVELGF